MKALVYVVAFFAFIGLIALGTFYLLQTREGEKNKTLLQSTMQNMVMPGPVSEAHDKYENQCTKCHIATGKQTESALCLDCHEDIDSDIATDSGFHGRSPSVKNAQCRICHTEHEGRGFDITRLDKGNFHHDLTDFKLSGAHASPSLSCGVCHEKGKKFRDASSTCFNCHKKDDHHKGKLGQDCATCHGVTSWKDTYFDHDKTNFPLKGKHQDVTCIACHTDNHFKETPRDCASCHQKDDIHKTPITKKCDQCHHSDSWLKVTFNHEHETKFPLTGKHMSLLCESCHQNLAFDGIKENPGCIDCHRDDDIHKGVNGPRCNQCHNSSEWKKISFNHNTDTDFRLQGSHKNIECSACHKSETAQKKLGTTCNDCHKSDDVHRGKLGQNCSECHHQDAWLKDITFDHDLTRFPLIGIHAITDCEECHLTSEFRDTNSACVSCHAENDFHHRALGDQCAACHNPNAWNLWQFDHNVQTDFILDGAHEDLICEKCHKIGRGNLSGRCYDCHESDNVHGGIFGSAGYRCDLCHTSRSFGDTSSRQIQFFHHNPTLMQVDLVGNCSTCHEDDDVHNGNFGQRCDRCHIVDSFKDVKIR